MKFTVIMFKDGNGNCPVRDFLDNIDPSLRVKFLYGIGLLEECGPAIHGKHTKHIRNGIFELREKSASGIGRVLFFFFYEHKIVLTNGFIKKTQKTPEKEILTAEKHRNYYVACQEREN